MNVIMEATYAARVKDGRGSGIGSDYKPWLKVMDVPSLGRSTRDKGWKTDRIHHCLSDLEANHFYMYEWDDRIIDIREQFPLRPATTIEIARRLNIEHPRNRKDGTNGYMVMTTDFLLSFESRLLAVSCKYRDDLKDHRVIEKMRIEREYWRREGVEWIIPDYLINNVRFVHQAYWLDIWPPLSDAQLLVLKQQMIKLLSRKQPIRQVTGYLDGLLSLPPGTSLLVLRHLIARRIIAVDMTQPIIFHEPLKIIGVGKVDQC